MKAPFVVNPNDDPKALRHEDLRDNYTIHGDPDTVGIPGLVVMEIHLVAGPPDRRRPPGGTGPV